MNVCARVCARYCQVLHVKRAREDMLLSHGVLPVLVGSCQHLNAWAKMRRKVPNHHNKFLGPQRWQETAKF